VYKDGKMTQELKTKPFNARDYLISDAPVNFIAPTPDAAVFINNSFQPEIAKSLAARINYGTSSYKLSTIGRYSFVNAPFGKTAIHRVEISALIILALIIILLIGRYGVLGLVSALAFTLFSTLTLLLFTVFQGQFTLLTIGAIIFGILLMLDYSVNTFERLKKELYEGKSINRAINASNKYSVPALFDSSFVVLMISFIIFYIGSTYLPGFSVIVVISLLLTIILSFIFINIFTRLLIKLNLFNKREFLLGNYNSKKDKYLATQSKLEKVNYSKRSK
jgi:SecD/SecF fusion protein